MMVIEVTLHSESDFWKFTALDSVVAEVAGTVAGWGPTEGAGRDAGGTGTEVGRRSVVVGAIAVILAAVRATIAAARFDGIGLGARSVLLAAWSAGVSVAASAAVIINRAANFIVAP